MEIRISNTQLTLDKRVCEVKWNDGHFSRYKCNWLRFNCKCSSCVPKVTATYTIDIPSFPSDLTIEEVNSIKDGDLLRLKIHGEIVDGHITELPASWLRSYCNCDRCFEGNLEKRDVITQHISAMKGQPKVVPTVDYNEIMENEDSGIFQVLKNVVEKGLSLIKNVPCKKGMVAEVAKKFGPIHTTVYGETSDVVITYKENAAYTPIKLPFHQDQQQYENAPGVEYLHALKFDSCITGGETRIADLFEVAQRLREESPEDFQTFVEVPACFDTVDFTMEVYLEHQKYHIVLDYFGKIVAVNWHPALTSGIRVREQDVDRYYKAHCKFLEILREKINHYKFRLTPGDLIVLNNRRVAHAREAFEPNGGERHLQTTYTNLCELKSKYMTTARKLGIEVVPPKIGNNSSF